MVGRVIWTFSWKQQQQKRTTKTSQVWWIAKRGKVNVSICISESQKIDVDLPTGEAKKGSI